MAMHRFPPGPGWLRQYVQQLDSIRDPLNFFTHASKSYGDVVCWRIFGMEFYLFSHPRDVEEVLRHQHANFKKDLYLQGVKRVTGNGLLTSEGEYWRRQRRLAQPAFHSKQIERYAPMMIAATEKMLAGWNADETLDIHEQMMRLTLAIVAKTLFDADVGGTAAAVGRDLEVLMTYYANPLHLFSWGQWLPTPSNLRFPFVLRRLDKIIDTMITERQATASNGADLLSRLLTARDIDGARMERRQIRDELLTLFLAGHETTALALSYTMMLLAEHPETMIRLQNEIRAEIGDRCISASDVSRLKLTEAVLMESMRLYPPAWTIGREAITDCEVGGYHVPKGAQVICSQWVVHRDERFFPDPAKFLPDRWLDGSAQRLPRCAYFPFGDGPRICIGQGFAMLEAVLVLATIAQHYSVASVPGQKLQLVPSITLRPKHGIRLRLTKVANAVISSQLPGRLDQPEVPAPISHRVRRPSEVSEDISRHYQE